MQRLLSRRRVEMTIAHDFAITSSCKELTNSGRAYWHFAASMRIESEINKLDIKNQSSIRRNERRPRPLHRSQGEEV